jgi:hypothetical protein
MKRTIPSHNLRAEHCRKVLAARRIGVNAKCSCGETHPEALTRKNGKVMCASCVRKARGHSDTDHHHVFGQANSDFIMLIPVNDHRVDLSGPQNAWPPNTLQNPERSPLLARAAFIRGFADIHAYLIGRFLLPSAEILELLDTELKKKLGKKWWKRTKLNGLEPKT